MHMKYLKEQLTARSLSGTGVKATLIDCFTEAMSNNTPVINSSLIVMPLLIVRVAPTSAINRQRGAAGSQDVPIDLTWVSLEANKEDQTTATNNFTPHNPADRLQTNTNIVQQSNFL